MMSIKWIRVSVRKLWSEPSTTVTGAAALIATASLTSRLLGVFRDRVLAGMFGAGTELDIYYAAFKVPDLLYNLLIVGALSAGFIPVFIATREKKNNGDHWVLVNGFLNIVLASLILGAGALFIFAPYLAPFVTPGFTPEATKVVGEMMRILALSPIILGVSAVVGAVLQSYRRFFVYSIAPIFYNIGIIIGALFLVESLGLYGLAWGVVLGALMHFAIQLPAVFSLGWTYKWCWLWRDRSIRKIFTLMLPRTLALSVTQFNLFFLTIVASFLTAGSIAVFTFATNLFFVPVALFGISYALASFPSLNEAQAQNDKKLFIKHLRDTTRSILFLIIPATVIYLVLRAQIVRVVLGSGAFDWADTVATFETLYWFSLAMFAHALIPLFVRAFYAYHKAFLPLMAGIIGDGITIITSLYLSIDFGVSGLAMAFSLGAMVNLFILYIFIHTRFGNLFDKNTSIAVLSMLVGGFIMAFVAQGVKTGIGSFYGTDTFLTILLQAGLTVTIAILAYIAVGYLLKSRELATIITALKKKVPSKLSGSLEEGESY